MGRSGNARRVTIQRFFGIDPMVASPLAQRTRGQADDDTAAEDPAAWKRGHVRRLKRRGALSPRAARSLLREPDQGNTGMSRKGQPGLDGL
jgi:hypothetical protein